MEFTKEEIYKLFGLKVDPKLYHHYIISIGIETAKSTNPGKIYLKYNPIHFTNDDILNMEKVSLAIKDRVFKTTEKEAVEMFNCKQLVNDLHGIILGSNANDCSLHHFSSEFDILELEENYFELLAELSNKFQHERELLTKSRIR